MGQNSLGASGCCPPRLWRLQGGVSLSGGVQGLLPAHSALGFPGGCRCLAGQGPGPSTLWEESLEGGSGLAATSAIQAQVCLPCPSPRLSRPRPTSPVFPPNSLPAWGSVRVSMLDGSALPWWTDGRGSTSWSPLTPGHLLSRRPGWRALQQHLGEDVPAQW